MTQHSAHGCFSIALGTALDVTMESERLIRVEGRHLRVRRSGTGPPILLLNGMGMSLSTWAPLDRHLDGFDRIRVGTPGNWRNPGPPARTDDAQLRGAARRPARSTRHRARRRARPVFGGMVAQQFAHDMPDQSPEAGPGFDVMWSGRSAQQSGELVECDAGRHVADPIRMGSAMARTPVVPAHAAGVRRQMGKWSAAERIRRADCGGVTVVERGVVAAAHPRDFGDHRHRRCVGALRECEHSGVQNASRSDLPCPWRRASVLVGSGR